MRLFHTVELPWFFPSKLSGPIGSLKPSFLCREITETEIPRLVSISPSWACWGLRLWGGRDNDCIVISRMLRYHTSLCSLRLIEENFITEVLYLFEPSEYLEWSDFWVLALRLHFNWDWSWIVLLLYTACWRLIFQFLELVLMSFLKLILKCLFYALP